MREAETRREVLIVDDDELFRWSMMRGFQVAGVTPYEADKQSRALEQLEQHPTCQRALIDLRLTAESGIDVLRSILAVRPDMRCVMFSGYCSTVVAVEAVRAGAVNVLPKSTSIPVLIAELESDDVHVSTAELEVPSLAQIEWDHIQRVLHDCTGNVSMAARKLGIHRQSLQRKLRRYAPPR